MYSYYFLRSMKICSSGPIGLHYYGFITLISVLLISFSRVTCWGGDFFIGDYRIDITEKEKSSFYSKSNSIIPGGAITFDFPELGLMANGQPAQCALWVPENYNPQQTTPFFVWFAGGKGSISLDSLRDLVDFSKFLVLALPYPDGYLPRLAIKEGEGAIDAFWTFQQPMLQHIIHIVPNISNKVRIVGGTSSGAHLVGAALDRDWEGFCDYFTGYVLHEGGSSPDMQFNGTRNGHNILIVYGEESPYMKWQIFFMASIRKARGHIHFLEVPGAGHSLNHHSRQAIRSWIENVFCP